jgi:hypothetical protein
MRKGADIHIARHVTPRRHMSLLAMAATTTGWSALWAKALGIIGFPSAYGSLFLLLAGLMLLPFSDSGGD